MEFITGNGDKRDDETRTHTHNICTEDHLCFRMFKVVWLKVQKEVFFFFFLEYFLRSTMLQEALLESTRGNIYRGQVLLSMKYFVVL